MEKKYSVVDENNLEISVGNQKFFFQVLGKIIGKWNGSCSVINAKNEVNHHSVWYLKAFFLSDDKISFRINSTLATSITDIQSITFTPNANGNLRSISDNATLTEISPNCYVRSGDIETSDIIQVWSLAVHHDDLVFTIQSFHQGIMKNTYISQLKRMKSNSETEISQ